MELNKIVFLILLPLFFETLCQHFVALSIIETDKKSNFFKITDMSLF